MVSWRSAHRKQRRFGELSARDRSLLFQALILLPVVSVGRRLMDFKRLRRLLARWSDGEHAQATHEESHLVRAQTVANIVRIAVAYSMPRPNCLDRSLVLWSLLRRREIASDLCLGVRKDGTELDAHAWIECDGVVLNDTPDVGERYTVINSD